MKKNKLFLVFLISSLLGSATANASQVLNASQTLTNTITIQPIIVSDNNGSNTATFFGNSIEKGLIENLIDNIWAQAGIDINFLSSSVWNNSFANKGNSSDSIRPRGDLSLTTSSAFSEGITHSDDNVINMFFVKKAAGFGILNENTTAGLAKTPGNGISQYVGSNLLSFTAGREVIASVVAHEIGHNLGLTHTNLSENLMKSNSDGDKLTASQINTALNSRFSTEGVETPTVIPVPAAFWLLGSGLIGLVSVKKSRKVLT